MSEAYIYFQKCGKCDEERVSGEGGAHDFRVTKDGSLWYYDSQFGWEGVAISYCPWCGRPLREEDDDE